MMRIITGTARGAKLETLEGDATRPTAERVKEALFSMLQFELEGRVVLDLFGGSGQLGLEALSRGAASATFIDSSREASDIIMQNARVCKLFDKCRISSMDSLAYLGSAAGRQSFDIIFLDPPYASGLLPECLGLIDKGGLLARGGVIVCESADEVLGKKKKKLRETDEEAAARVLETVFGGDEALAERYSLRRTARYGQTRLTLLEAAVSDTEE